MRNLIFFPFAALFFIFFVLLLKSEDRREFQVHLQGASFIEGMKIINKRNGNESWALTAKRANIDEHRNKAHLEDMEMTIKEKGLLLHAESGIYDLTDKTLAITSTVTADNKSYSLITDNVTVDSLTHNIASSGNVKINGKTFTIEGTGMEITNRKQNVRILKDVTATFNNN